MNLESKLKALYDRLDKLGDLRDRGYPVSYGDIGQVKHDIRLLESIQNETDQRTA